MDESRAQPENHPRSPRLGFLSRIAKHPVVSIVGPIIGLTSLTLGIVFFLISREEPKLSYAINSVRTTILQSGRASSLRVYHGDEEVATDVTAVQIAIWNRGRQSIRPGDVLEEVQIVLTPSPRILEANVREQTRSVVAFRHDDSRYQEGVIPVSWRILEKDDGALIEVIYAGPEDTEVTVIGTVEGQRTLHVIGVQPQTLYWPLFAVQLLVFGVMLFLLRVYDASIRPVPRSLIVFLVFSTLALIFFPILRYVFGWSWPSRTPFF